MKRISFLFFVSLISFAAFSQTGSHSQDTLIFTAVDEMPDYPDSDEARMKMITYQFENEDAVWNEKTYTAKSPPMGINRKFKLDNLESCRV